MGGGLVASVNNFTLVYLVDQNFTAQVNLLYLVSAAGGNVNVQLPAEASVSGQPLIIKRVDSSGHSVNVVPASGESINGLSAGISLTQQGQGRWFWPGAPAGPAAGTGWTSY